MQLRFYSLLLIFAVALSAAAAPIPTPQDPIDDLDLLLTDELTNSGMIIKKRQERVIAT
ncbi:hypothetical protein SCHPADRAFT_909624 [Schizopora paradoxa]|uniref:Uncharacterized protein n=1 Tax=Schizopora paradoxa TaxID=27342 RepID=A0A0H2R5Z5_9AGAM|nr:hypothetical protein SCHPADRAFT_909624 [Schizopora paradoxa]